MRLRNIVRSIEAMPRAAYIFLRSVLALAALMLLFSCILFQLGQGSATVHLAVQLLETPAGVLLLGAVGLAFLLDQLQ